MTPMPLIFAATCDIAGKMRGKAFPADQLEKRLKRGVGWVPTNVQITCFDGIGDSPFGSLGDLLLIPDPASEVNIAFGDAPPEHFMLGDIVTLEGEPWDFCTRQVLRDALARLHRLSGANLHSAFEHEFQLKGSGLPNQGFGRNAFENQRRMLETLMGALKEAGLSPDSIMKEYGPNQFEVVVAPADGAKSADQAVILRELTRSAALHLGEEATFAPILDPASVGNGVHIHLSFHDDDDVPLTYDENGPCGMSQLTDAFAAGVLKYMPHILALTAPSVVSYERLTPHRWSAAYNNLGFRDREASLRVCPVTAKDPASIAQQFNIEYRAADAAACPHLALAAVVHAGCQGIEDGLTAPEATQEDLSLLSADALAARGYARLPETLEAALDSFAASTTVTGWFPDQFADVYRAHKLAEIAHLADRDIDAKCAAYADTY
ncbi:glutamine synthetase family protein [Sulfitobacter sp. S190]|uniref:glutamine synthetase family protein n=1 Tax=Sulfitobacter sp. S190 TaxID=2867022 RepID=UPI0021A6CCAF|nr:glutamine synthetase family protein [Sulfitobacter sp. S190]UWR22141.1 glutamine synthetase family protein [Sulfitobacter sp. S190]